MVRKGRRARLMAGALRPGGFSKGRASCVKGLPWSIRVGGEALPSWQPDRNQMGDKSCKAPTRQNEGCPAIMENQRINRNLHTSHATMPLSQNAVTD
jgi:hypothetical protein